ncbi:uncharacterized protein [Halyomorpha halys]|uniref:uncharacterized protein n=1 Tax=Halyomorpha halys TaxID=286706 RepID=UPI0006D4EC45|nr:uncharacterized protein LOC106680676 [Halyomorpha halys]
MWWSYLFVCILLFSTVPSYSTPLGFYGSSRYGKRTAIARREPRSGIFWTGSRYNRRGSDILGMKSTRKGSDNFFMGSRYGKRTGLGENNTTFDVDLCKFNKYLYPCKSSSR